VLGLIEIPQKEESQLTLFIPPLVIGYKSYWALLLALIKLLFKKRNKVTTNGNANKDRYFFIFSSF
jgi:hypothetical protein